MSVYLHRSGLIGGAGVGGGGGGGDPFFANVLAQWDFENNGLANQGSLGSSYDMTLTGSAAFLSGPPGILDLPGGTADSAETSTADASALALTTGDFAYEAFNVNPDSTATQAIWAINDTVGNNRSIVFRIDSASSVSWFVYLDGTATATTLAHAPGGTIVSTGSNYYAGLFWDDSANTAWTYWGLMGSSLTAVSHTLNYGPFAAAERFIIGQRGEQTNIPYNGQIGAVRISNSLRGVSGGSLTPDSLPLTTS